MKYIKLINNTKYNEKSVNCFAEMQCEYVIQE